MYISASYIPPDTHTHATHISMLTHVQYTTVKANDMTGTVPYALLDLHAAHSVSTRDCCFSHFLGEEIEV